MTLGLGEHGDVFYSTENGRVVAMIYYRDYSGIRRRLRAKGRSKAEARRRVNEAMARALAVGSDGDFTARSTLADGANGWLAMYEGLVQRGSRSPSTLDLYRHAVERHVIPGVGALRLGEVSTARMDRFLQSVLDTSGYATAKLCRTVLSGICGWLVRRDGLKYNPIRDVTPLEQDRDRTARALSVEEIREWLAILDADPVARRKDLPELARFILSTGLRLGEALVVRWSDVDMDRGVVNVERTVIRVKGHGLKASRLKSRTSYRVLVLPGGAWRCCVPGGCGSVPLTGRCSLTRRAAIATGTTSQGPSARCGPAPTSTGSSRTPTARPWPPCSTEAAQRPG
jgi:hypothetical protein